MAIINFPNPVRRNYKRYEKMKRSLFLKIFRVILVLNLLSSICMVGKISLIYAEAQEVEFFEIDVLETEERAQKNVSHINKVFLNTFVLPMAPRLLSRQDLMGTILSNPNPPTFCYKFFSHSPPLLA